MVLCGLPLISTCCPFLELTFNGYLLRYIPKLQGLTVQVPLQYGVSNFLPKMLRDLKINVTHASLAENGSIY